MAMEIMFIQPNSRFLKKPKYKFNYKFLNNKTKQ
jgi:hypothetical protein